MATQKRKIRIGAGIVLLLMLSFFYFSQHDTSSLSPDAELDNELAGLSHQSFSKLPNSTMDLMSSKARAAVNKGNYALGMKIVDALSTVNDLSPEQAISLRNTVQTIKVQMAQAALSGDTNAEKALAFFKSTSVLGR